MRLFKRKTASDEAIRCPECGERVPRTAEECAMCGHELADVPDEAVRADQPLS
jgi:DNA-directed RNA polymerase subunit RPC12/RpoP